MSIKIIDNKKIELTEDEWQSYNDICRSYDKPPAMQGKSLFIGLFETDDRGIITFIRAPSVRQTSMEVFLFICSIMQHQQLRLMNKQVDDLCAEIRSKADAIFKEIKAEAEKTLANLVVADKPSKE